MRKEKAFFIPFLNYDSHNEITERNNFIHIGFLSEENSLDGEICFEWNDIGIKLCVYEDSWGTLSSMPELIELMAYINRNKLTPSIEEFTEILKENGFIEITERICSIVNMEEFEGDSIKIFYTDEDTDLIVRNRQRVEVIKELSETEYHLEEVNEGERVYLVRFPDGCEIEVYEGELKPVKTF